MNSGAALIVLFLVPQVILFVLMLFLLARYRRLRQRHDQLLQENELIFGFVHDVGEAFSNIENIEVDALLNKVLYYALRTTHASSGAVYLLDEEHDLLAARALSGLFPPLSAAPDDAGLRDAVSKSAYVEQLVRSHLVRRGEGLIGQAADLGQPLLIRDAERDPRIPLFQEDFLRVRSILLVPLRLHHRILGVLAVVNPVHGQPFAYSDMNLLQALADQSSISLHYAQTRRILEQKQRLDQDLQLARRIQTSLLPKSLPSVAGVDVAAYSSPALEVGGDYYDVMALDADHLGIAIADVSGKGIGGAIMMSICRSVLHARVHDSLSPAEVLRQVNQLLAKDLDENMFVSMLYMVLDLRTHRLTVARAGHERAILCRGDGAGLSLIDAPGMAVGLGDPEVFNEQIRDSELMLHRGDFVVLYTDGITEAMNDVQAEWGLDNLLDTIRTGRADSAAGLVTRIRENIGLFVGAEPQNDDMSIVALRIVL